MAMTNITVKAPKVSREITVPYDFGDNLAAMTAKFTEQVVYDHAYDNMVIALQAFVRGRLERGIDEAGKRDAEKYLDDGAIKTALKAWKPSSRKAADPAKKVETVKKAFGSMSEADKKALLAALREEMKGGTKAA